MVFLEAEEERGLAEESGGLLAQAPLADTGTASLGGLTPLVQVRDAYCGSRRFSVKPPGTD